VFGADCDSASDDAASATVVGWDGDTPTAIGAAFAAAAAADK